MSDADPGADLLNDDQDPDLDEVAAEPPALAADPATQVHLRHLPAIDRVKAHPALAGLDLSPAALTALCRDVVAAVRARILDGTLVDPGAIAAAVATALRRNRALAEGPSLRRILNGSGVLLHTNAGRAPLPPAALAAIQDTARGHCNLELALETGRRGSRQDHVRSLLRWLTGAPAALVVNNGAAAILLALHALARGRQVVVSRGELVEIGGGFRIPEVLSAAGAGLCEVGTTNRTHLRDYENALEASVPPIAAILQVHRSNFAVVGFTAAPQLAQLADLAHSAGLPLLVDLGSGALSHAPGDRREPTVHAVLAAGADLVTFSGDKRLGGPQAGLIVGRADLVQTLARSPMARALRVGSLTLAALEATLRLHLQGRGGDLPVPHALGLPEADVAALAQALAMALQSRLGPPWQVTVEPAEAQLGGGTDPLVRVPSRALAIRHPLLSATRLAQAALQAPVPLLGRPRGDRLLLDVRSLLAGTAGAAMADLAAELAASLAAIRLPS